MPVAIGAKGEAAARVDARAMIETGARAEAKAMIEAVARAEATVGQDPPYATPHAIGWVLTHRSGASIPGATGAKGEAAARVETAARVEATVGQDPPNERGGTPQGGC